MRRHHENQFWTGQEPVLHELQERLGDFLDSAVFMKITIAPIFCKSDFHLHLNNIFCFKKKSSMNGNFMKISITEDNV